jgi:site-specific recombinase XerD
MMLVRGKGGHERVLPISDETMDALNRYLAEHPGGAGPLVRSYHDEKSPITATHLGHLVAQWMLDAGIKQAAHDGRGCHSGRHTMASDMVRAGESLRNVQAALGHESISTTQIYLPWVIGDLRKAMGGRQYRRAATRQRRDETA